MPNNLPCIFCEVEKISAKTIDYKIRISLARLSQRKGQTGLTKTKLVENDMHRSRYDDRYWESRFDRALRGRAGFAWGAFFIGFILGGIIF